ncbi:MAG: hypothetical protein N3A60_07185 [Thermanaerothrix sp.]|nr:hypothetical protein [Thermanaerothrix sp.]
MKKIKPSLSNRYVLVGDLLLAVISVLGSYALRLELGSQFFDYLPSALWMIGLALVIKPVVYYLFGLYQRIWIYASVEELKLIVAAVTAASVLLAGGMVVALSLGAFVGLPRSVLVIDWLLSMILVGGLRFSFRLMAESRGPVASLVTQPRRVLIVGAGDAGALVVREMQKNPQLNLQPIGFLDDNPA